MSVCRCVGVSVCRSGVGVGVVVSVCRVSVCRSGVGGAYTDQMCRGRVRNLGLRRFKFFVFLMLSVLRYLDRVWSFSLSLSLSQSHSSVPAPVAGYGMVPGPIIERWCSRCL